MTHLIQFLFGAVCPGLIIELKVTTEESFWVVFSDYEAPAPRAPVPAMAHSYYVLKKDNERFHPNTCDA